MADIQSPPGSIYTPIRKLSRGLANVFYGVAEIPASFETTLKEEGGREAFSYGLINGIDRAGTRIAYGLFEVVNFRTPKYKNSYRPFYDDIDYDTVHGYTEFPPAVGFEHTSHVRIQTN
ncbi:MAG: exosortase system-associated protein, TIGR04073 family [Verrucomicrobiota bacterium]